MILKCKRNLANCILNKKRGKGVITLFLCVIMLILLTACGGSSKKTLEKIDDRVEIPEDGIITAKQFEAFAGTDRKIVFYGENNGIKYEWEYSGKNIHNPVDLDLSVDFLLDNSDLESIKNLSGNATYAVGLKLKGSGLITVPTLTITLPEKWDADIAVFCKEKDKTAMKLSDADISSDEEKTVLSVKVTEVGDTYYIVGGLSKDAVAKREADKKEQDEKDKSDKDKKDKDKKLTCTISINCSTILKNMDKLDSDRKEFVPKDGWILAPVEVEFKDGDTVLDVLSKVCKQNNIQLEHSYTPVYGSSYIEGINQLYEFNCGELSGWMFSVDGWFPNYGCDKYEVSDGETIAWVYTCDLGKDVGDNSMWE